MPKEINIPPEIARQFVQDMIAFHAAGGTGVTADGIAARQLSILKDHYSGKLKLHDIKTMFSEMRDHLP